MSATMSQDLVFHLLDIQARDMRVESEEEDVREVVYESHSDDDEIPYRKKQKTSTFQPRELVLHLFGSTETGTPVRCDVTGFRPTLYLRLPEEKTNLSADCITQYIQRERIPMDQLTIKRVTKKIFYGFTANTFYPFLEITVPSLSLFRTLRQLFLDESMNCVTKKPLDGAMKGKKVEVFEANLDPMLRFLHTQNIQPCGWVSIKGALSSKDALSSTILIDCDYQEVLPTKGPRVTAPFLTASWDIECFSMTGDFPVPKRTWKKAAQDLCSLATTAEQACDLILKSLSITQFPVDTLPKGMTPIYCQLKKSMDVIRTRLYKPTVLESLEEILSSATDEKQETLMTLLQSTLNPVIKLVGDPVIQIGTTLTRGTPETTERHLFVFPDCAAIPNIEVHAFATEKEMIHAWFEWMIQRNPDIMIGYNVFGFDESYTWYRAEELGLIHANSPIHELTRLFELAGEVKLEEKFLSSSAMGDNRMYIWSLHGRLQIDLFHYIKRNNVLPSYKLDEVTKHFMSGKLKKQSYDPRTQLLVLEVAGAVKDVRVGRAIALLDETGETVSDKLVVTAVDGAIITIQCGLDEDALNEMEDATKWVIVKDDVSPQDIFRLHRGSAEDRAVVGKYCLQDCDLVIDLYKKLETFNNSMSMANVCSVPVSYIFTRGQGIKIESLIFKQCRERNIVIPVLTIPSQGGSDDSYEGAIVLDPEPGFYAQSPIGVCDFASLYPSTIVSENISHDSLLWIKDFQADGTLIQHQWGSEAYDECDGYAYTDIEFDIIRADPTDGRKHPRKIACGRRICRYAQPLDGTKSTLPQITTWLLNARSAKKKEMKAEKDPERYALLDAEQLAYKLTGNSLYGQLGSGTFKIRLQALAASVTSYGRKQILFAKAAIEQFYGPGAQDPRCTARAMAKVVYGDSVTGDTPLVLRNETTGSLFMKRMDELCSDEWHTYHDTKDAISLQGISVWTERGFTPIHRIIRHRLHQDKKLFRINTHTGIVDVTEDHSLVLKDGKEAKPCDVVIGTELLHNDLFFEEFNHVDTPCMITEDEAFVMGFFVADGSSDVYECPSGRKASWAINKADLDLLTIAMQKCPFPATILNTIESSGVYKLVPVGNITKIATEYRELFYNSHREKKIPDIILTAPLPIIQSFWNGFYVGDGDKDVHGYTRFDQKGKEIGAGMYLLARRLGYHVSINERASKECIFRYTMTRKTQRKSADAIKKYRELPHPGDVYVYDLETDNHHFGVGPGALIVHNTDSLFVEFNPRNPETGERLEGREARVATIEMTDEAGAFITKTLAPPHDFEFDKCFDPLLMFSKKRYAGNMYESNPDEYVHKYMGIALKRRDNAPIVKTIFGGAMKMLLDKRDVIGAFTFVKEKCLELVEGKVSLGQLTVTKSLRADYADPSRIAHKALADRITERDPGNAPAAGDRIGYVYISAKAGQQASKLQGERIETPLFIKEHGLLPDYQHYIEHQLQNPISQAFGLLLEQVPGYTKEMMKGCPSLETDLDRYLTFREGKAAELLFHDCLQRFHMTSTRSAIHHMFGGNVVITPSLTKTKPRVATSAALTATSATATVTKKVTQTTMSSFLYDSFLVDSIKKKERAAKKKKEDAASTSASP
jgi:DNA polymerase elongation subunit (family B)|uniref:DNA polymerase n=1 Tax=viral metagenome TaxID=1070528 RepID=A0A6C0BHK0_9ZZZZ